MMDNSKKQELLKKVNAVIDYIKPYLQADGGDVTLIDITDDLTVKVMAALLV
jgi:Fe-S cluster biogenesis protein NfuA